MSASAWGAVLKESSQADKELQGTLLVRGALAGWEWPGSHVPTMLPLAGSCAGRGWPGPEHGTG